MVKLIPFNNYILFKPFKGDEKSEGGILIPESFRSESDKGIIVAVGEGTELRPMRLKPNSVGYRVHGWGTPIDENGERYYLMEDKAILSLE